MLPVTNRGELTTSELAKESVTCEHVVLRPLCSPVLEEQVENDESWAVYARRNDAAIMHHSWLRFPHDLLAVEGSFRGSFLPANPREYC